MEWNVAHPYGQLELDMRGVAPLAAAEQLQRLVAISHEGSIERAQLEVHLLDERSRRARAERLRWLWEIRAPYRNGMGWLTPGGSEGLWLYHEASQCYVLEQYIATVLTAHACCERTIAGYLSFEDRLDRRLAFAGLGPLARAARECGLISQTLLERLLLLNDIRKVTAHFKPPLDPHSVHMRLAAPGLGLVDDDNIEDAIDATLAEDAQASLIAATEVVRGIGFNEVSSSGGSGT
jgi:hypothetical protein